MELERESLTPDESRARDAVRALPQAAADPAFRARLGQQFVSGAFAPAPARARRLPWHRRPMTHWTLAAAAAVAMVAGFLVLNQGPAWHALSAHGTGIAVVDGRRVPLGAGANLDQIFRPGTRVLLPDGADVTLRAGDQMLMQILPGSDITVPSVPGRWIGRSGIGEVRAGELRITTGAAFHGGWLALATPDARVQVTGTTLAVISEPTGTCVCVLEGVARVGPDARSMEPVTPGTRGYVYADGRPMLHAAMRPEETPALGALREAGRSMLGRAGR